MLTSAHCLRKILTQCIRTGQEKARFTMVLRDVLGKDEVSEVDAIKRVYDIALKVKSDINQLPHAEEKKQHLLSLFSPYQSILNFSAFSSNMGSLRNSLLKKENLDSLTSIDIALSGFATIGEISDEVIEQATKLRDLRIEIGSSSLPDSLRLSICERLRQIENALEKYYAFGADYVEREINELTGTVVLSLVDAPAEKTLLRKVIETTGAIRKSVREAGGFASEITTVSQQVSTLVEFITRGG